MIKQGIVNFFKNLKYFFTPLGTIALGLVFGLSVLIPGVISSVSTLAGDVKTILEGSAVDLAVLKDGIFSAVKALDWGDPLAAVRTLASADWIRTTLNALVGTEEYTAQFTASIQTFTHSLGLYLSAVVSFTAIGMIAGYFLTRWLIRRNMAKRTIKTFLLHALVDSFLTVALAGVCAWLATLWRPSILISTLFAVVFFGTVSLFEAFLIHGRGKIALKKIVNFKNVMKLFVTNLIIFLLTAALVALVVFVVNVIVGVFVGIAFLEIGFIVIALNAEAYVKTSAENAQTIQNAQSPAEIG